MSYREWEEDPRNRRGRHSAPDGWVASDETNAGQTRWRGRARGSYPSYGDQTGDVSGYAGGGSPRSYEPPADSRGWSVPDRLEDTGAWTRGAHTGEWERDEGWPARPEPDSAPPDGPAGHGGYGGWGERAEPSRPDAGGSWSGSGDSWSSHGPSRLDPTPRSGSSPSWSGSSPSWSGSPDPWSSSGDSRSDPGGSWSGSGDSWSGSGSSRSAAPQPPARDDAADPGYGRRRATEPRAYGRPALPSAESPPPAAPTSSGAYVGEVLPRDYGGRSGRDGYPGSPDRDSSYPPAPSYRDAPGYRDRAPRRDRSSWQDETAQHALPAYNEPSARRRASYDDAPTYGQPTHGGEPGPARSARYRDEPAGYRDEPAGYRDEPAGYRDDPAGHRAQPASYRDQPGTYRDQPAGYRDQPAPNRDQPPSYRGGPPRALPPAYRDQPASYRDQPASYRDQPASYRDQPATYRDQPGNHRNEPATYRGRPASYRGDAAYREQANDGSRSAASHASGPGAYAERDRAAPAGQAAYRAGAGDYRQREGSSPYPDGPRRRPKEAPPNQRRVSVYDVDEDDEVDDEPEPGGYRASMVYTMMWYAVPMVVWVLWSLTLNGQASATCIDDGGVPCASERAEALTTLTDNLPRMFATMLFSILIAVALRRVSSSWKAATVGFAAAVVGGGLATVAVSVFTGQPIG